MKRSAKATPPAGHLTEDGAMKFSMAAPWLTRPWMPCSNGTVYASFAPMPPPGSPTPPPSPFSLSLWRISLDSQTVTRYPTPPLDGYRLAHLYSFNVDPQGNLYALYYAYKRASDDFQSAKADHVIVKFNEDGSVDSQIVLGDVPVGTFGPQVFQIFGDGNILAAGSLNTYSGPSENPPGRFVPPQALPRGAVGRRPTWLHSFIGIFDRSGNFMQELKLSGDETPGSGATPNAVGEDVTSTTPAASPAPGQQASHATPKGPWNDPVWDAAQSMMTAAPNGDAYLLLPSNPAALFEITSDGRVLHEARIESPRGGFHPRQMSAAGNAQVFITFSGTEIDENGMRQLAAVVARVNADEGTLTATYQVPLRNHLHLITSACALGSNELVFLGSGKDRHLEAFKYRTN